MLCHVESVSVEPEWDVVLVERQSQEGAASGSHLDATADEEPLVSRQTAAVSPLTQEQQQQQQQHSKQYFHRETQC